MYKTIQEKKIINGLFTIVSCCLSIVEKHGNVDVFPIRHRMTKINDEGFSIIDVVYLYGFFDAVFYSDFNYYSDDTSLNNLIEQLIIFQSECV